MLPGRLRSECRSEAQVLLQQGHTRSGVAVNKARQRRRVPLQLLGMDYRVRLGGPQQGTSIILSALSSLQVFLLPRPVT